MSDNTANLSSHSAKLVQLSDWLLAQSEDRIALIDLTIERLQRHEEKTERLIHQINERLVNRKGQGS